MMRFIKDALERTPMAAIYRAARDEWNFSRQELVDTPFGYRFVGPRKMQAGTFESQERLELQRHLASADVFVDIGANVGYFTCLACSMGKQVVAVEPLVNNLRYLYMNLEANGWADRVEIYPVGLASKPGLAKLYGGGTGASLLRGWAGVSPSFQRTIPLSTLDVLLGERFRGKQIVVKMDIEGCEYNALLGASNILRAVPRPVWLVEITLSEHRGDRNPHFLTTFELFWGLGYKAAAVGSRNKELSPPEIKEYCARGTQPPSASGNYLFNDSKD